MSCRSGVEYLYLLHELADFLHGGLFEFEELRLVQQLLLHVHKLMLQLLQPLSPLLAQPEQSWR